MKTEKEIREKLAEAVSEYRDNPDSKELWGVIAALGWVLGAVDNLDKVGG